MTRLVLASTSPARLGLLRAAGFAPEVVPSGVDEAAVVAAAQGKEAAQGSSAEASGGLRPAALVRLLAEAKAWAVADSARPGDVVVGCDSMLDLNGRAIGKPADAAEAIADWHAMRGRSAILRTGHCLIDVSSSRRAAAVASTVVRFGNPSDAEVEAYVATGEPLQVAGACTIDGRGAAFVNGIDGDPGCVIGISIPLLRSLLADLGVSIVDLWV